MTIATLLLPTIFAFSLLSALSFDPEVYQLPPPVRVRLPWVIYSHPNSRGSTSTTGVYPPVMLRTAFSVLGIEEPRTFATA